MPKSVLLVSWFFYPRSGGSEMIALNQARYLSERGVRVAVLTSKVVNCPDDDVHEGIKIFRRDFIDSNKSYSRSEIEEQFGAIIDEMNPEIIHFHNGSYPSASKDMNAGAQNIKTIFELAKEHNIYVIEHSHNAQLKDPVATKQLRELPWDLVICVSHFVKKKWEEFGNRAKKLVIIHNGIDLEKFKGQEPSKKIIDLKDDKEIIFFPARVVSMSQGGLSKQKNFALVVRACKQLLVSGNRNFKLVAIMNKAERNDDTKTAYAELDRLLEEYDLGEQIVFVPEVLPEEMPAYYAAVEIICVPSFYETFGLVYLEAMAMGKIAIASNTGGPTEYIKNGENGFLVDPNKPDDLAKVLYSVLSEKNLRRKIGRNATTTAENFSYKKMMEKVLMVYTELGKEDK